MNKKQIEFIKKIHTASGKDNQLKIEDLFPSIFPKNIVPKSNTWYLNAEGKVFYVKNKNGIFPSDFGFGFNLNGEWNILGGYWFSNNIETEYRPLREASISEVIIRSYSVSENFSTDVDQETGS